MPGKYTGRISVNGQSIDPLQFTKTFAFVEQHNTNHHEYSTVREALTFAAKLVCACMCVCV